MKSLLQYITEDPDVFDPIKGEMDSDLYWEDSDAIGFLFDSDWTCYLTEFSGAHNAIVNPKTRKTFFSEIDGKTTEERGENFRKKYFQGRVWQDDDFNLYISFWTKPDKQHLDDIIKKLNKSLDAVSFKLPEDDIADAIVDINDKTKIVRLKDLFKNDNKIDFDLTPVHTMSPSQKKKSPQLNAFLKNRGEANGKKLGKMTQAEYNYYKRYGMGDSLNIPLKDYLIK